MSQSLSQIYIHATFSTKDRINLLRKDDLPRIHAYIAGTLTDMGCPALKVGGTENHVHALFVQSKNLSLAQTMENVKRASSKWIKTQHASYRAFAWQEGYGAFSVSQSSVDAVVKYISEQEEHHKRFNFQEEVKRFFDLYKVQYDERYL